MRLVYIGLNLKGFGWIGIGIAKRKGFGCEAKEECSARYFGRFLKSQIDRYMTQIEV